MWKCGCPFSNKQFRKTDEAAHVQASTGADLPRRSLYVNVPRRSRALFITRPDCHWSSAKKSFNVRGEPIICTPTDAFKCFMGTEMDMLVVGNYVLYKEHQIEALKKNYEKQYELD